MISQSWTKYADLRLSVLIHLILFQNLLISGRLYRLYLIGYTSQEYEFLSGKWPLVDFRY